MLLSQLSRLRPGSGLVPAARACMHPTVATRLAAASVRMRCTSTAPPESDAPAPPEGAEGALLFEGPKHQWVRTMKKISIANLTFACASSPIIIMTTDMAGAPGTGIAMSALIMAFGGGTTAGLMWATKTYVKAVHAVVGRDAARLVTPTFFGNELVTEVAFESVTPITKAHPFATFEADGRLFYLDEVGEIDPEFKARLQELLPHWEHGMGAEEEQEKSKSE
tara:strand:+ start:61 stop:729 length:669 start_codon:yes stop_codon:yes gene_type:complete